MLGNTSSRADQNPSAPSPIATVGATRPRALSPISTSRQLCFDSRTPSSIAKEALLAPLIDPNDDQHTQLVIVSANTRVDSVDPQIHPALFRQVRFTPRGIFICPPPLEPPTTAPDTLATSFPTNASKAAPVSACECPANRATAAPRRPTSLAAHTPARASIQNGCPGHCDRAPVARSPTPGRCP